MTPTEDPAVVAARLAPAEVLRKLEYARARTFGAADSAIRDAIILITTMQAREAEWAKERQAMLDAMAEADRRANFKNESGQRYHALSITEPLAPFIKPVDPLADFAEYFGLDRECFAEELSRRGCKIVFEEQVK